VCFAIWLVVQQEDIPASGGMPLSRGNDEGAATGTTGTASEHNGLRFDHEDVDSPFESTYLSRHEAERIRLQHESKLKAEADEKRLVAEAEKKRLEAEAEKKRLAAEAEKKRLAAEAEKKRMQEEARARAEAEKKRLEEERKRTAEAEARRLEQERLDREKAAQAKEVPPPPPPPPSPPPPVKKETFSILYRGIMTRTDGSRVALIESKQWGRTQSFKKGEQVGGFELIRMDRDRIELLNSLGETNVADVGEMMTWEVDSL